MPGVQHKHDARGELDQPDPAKVHHIAGELIEVPANGHSQHLKRTGSENTRKPKGDERSVMAKQQGRGDHLKAVSAGKGDREIIINL
ncbi:hypothetical protein Pfra02_01900 [Pseudomonas fragi]|nr:hypothetical protein Pfra02_01900 [Pseudomonas fragi]